MGFESKENKKKGLATRVAKEIRDTAFGAVRLVLLPALLLPEKGGSRLETFVTLGIFDYSRFEYEGYPTWGEMTYAQKFFSIVVVGITLPFYRK